MIPLPDFLTRKVDVVNRDIRRLVDKSDRVNSVMIFGCRDGHEHGVPLQSDVLLSPKFLALYPQMAETMAEFSGLPLPALIAAVALSQGGEFPIQMHGAGWVRFVIDRLRVIQPNWFIVVDKTKVLEFRGMTQAHAARRVAEVERRMEVGAEDDGLLDGIAVIGHNAVRSYGIVTPYHRGPAGIYFDQPKVIDTLSGCRGPLDGDIFRQAYAPGGN